MRPWTQVDLVLKTLFSAQHAADKYSVMYYFLVRYLAARYKVSIVHTKQMAIRFRNGLRLNVSAQSGGLSAYYEIFCQKMYSRLPDFIPVVGDCVVDVGANIGIYSMWAGRKVGKTGMVFSIEPHPDAFRLLKRNIDNNRCRSNVFNVGCSDSDGFLELHFNPSHLGSASFGTKVGTHKLLVPVKRLDDLMADVRPKKIKILKIDVEGWELQVLKGAEETLRIVDRVVLEVQGKTPASAVLGYLLGRGFNMVYRIHGVWNEPDLQVLYFRRNGA